MAFIEDVLESRPIRSNSELLAFQFPGRNIIWKDLIVPISRRGAARNLGRNFKHLSQERSDEFHKNPIAAKVMVCHDLKGNYREDRRYSSSKKWDDYRFYNWAGIDYFCYFSHHYVTIPPAGWINAAHKHGVVMLGTFIVEGGNCNFVTEVLRSRELIDKTINALVQLCEHFCFEGYLLNIECTMNSSMIPNLQYFVEKLTQRIHTFIPHGTIVWYDSVTTSGVLSHQNELNYRNKMFFELCDGMLINYNWSDDSLLRTDNLIREFYRGQKDKVFIGVDVFGRSQPAKFETHRLLQRIVPYGFSVGLFAMAWTFEHLMKIYDLETPEGDELLNAAFLTSNDTFWDLLWQYLPTKPYTELPFYSSFCLGSGKQQFNYGNTYPGKFFNLSKQALQPSTPLYGVVTRSFDEGLNGGSCLAIKQSNENIRLFCTDFNITKSFMFAFASKVAHPSADLECILQMTVEGSISDSFQVVLGSSKLSSVDGNQIRLPAVEDYETYKIAEYLARSFTQLKLPFTLANDWKVRYFIGNFTTPVSVTDIGVVLKASIETEAYLGAIHFHAANFEMDGSAIVKFDLNRKK